MSKPGHTVFGLHPRTATRVVVSVVVFVGVVVWFREPLVTLVGLLGSAGVSGRERTLVLLAALSTLVPLFIATVLADAIYAWLADE